MRLGEKVKIEIFDLPELLIWLMLKGVSVGSEMAGKLGYPIVRKTTDPGPQGVMTYIPREDEVMVGGIYFRRGPDNILRRQ